jgi:hypothetical protein
VLLFTDKPLPLIVPYLYKKDPKNSLQDWLLINCKGERSKHHIDSFKTIDADDLDDSDEEIVHPPPTSKSKQQK